MVEVLTMREIAASSSATAGPSPPFSSTTNLPLLSAFLAFSVAQFLKIFTTWESINEQEIGVILRSEGLLRVWCLKAHLEELLRSHVESGKSSCGS